MGMVCGLAAAVLACASPATAALTRVGRLAPLPSGARTVGPVAGSTPLHVTVTLRPRDPAALANYARAVGTPGSPDYHHYLTPAQFAQRFGATRSQIHRVTAGLRAHGLRPGPVSAGGLSIPVAASAGALEQAFSVSLSRLALPGRRAAIVAGTRAAVSSSIAGDVQSVLGLTTTAAPRPLLVRRPALTAGAAAHRPLAIGHTATGGPQACAQARSTAATQSAYTADQIASAYGFSGLYGAGDLGAGTTVAVYELEPNDPSDIGAYESCYGLHTHISYVSVDGGAGTGPGSGEAALDIENLIGLAPNANVIVYQGPNSASGSPGSGPYDTFSQIINQDRARVVSVSWGQCEAALGRDNATAEDTLFQQAAIQGQTIVAAAGDNGSADCDTGGALPQTQLAVDDPSSQPFVTGVGGTSLTALGPRPTEHVWNSGGTPVSIPGQAPQPGAGGGGVSNFWGMPPAQLNAGSGLGVRGSAAAGSACGNTAGYCREVPDVSADGDPSTGYLIYWNGSGSVSGQEAGWQGIGGTSAAAPLWAAIMALGDADPACAGVPIGYADPGLYRAAGRAYGASFNDVTTGNNDFTGTNGGQYPAASGYDPASGLGTPVASSLVPALCGSEARLRATAPQRSTVHAAVSLRLHGTVTPGSALTYRAFGLPPGLRLNQSTGLISGRPSRTGQFIVRVNAVDGDLATAGQTLTWTVGAAPRISRLTLQRGPHGSPLLSFTVAAGRQAPQLQTLAITLPSGLRVAARRGVSVTSTGRRPIALRFTDHGGPAGTLTIRLRRAAESMHVTLAPPSLSLRTGRIPALRGGNHVALMISVTDSSAGQSRLSARVTVA
ncbi:MAG: protease pro-enzyme activation domain-containing protein [Solirubrobacteraceae bacterium]